MTEMLAALYDEETLTFDVPDAALELAGSKCGDGPAASATLAFCSGLDTCPSLPTR
jgi:hypothetical protein